MTHILNLTAVIRLPWQIDLAPLRPPERYSFGDNFHPADVRLSRTSVIEPRLSVSLIGEAFNLYNVL